MTGGGFLVLVWWFNRWVKKSLTRHRAETEKFRKELREVKEL